MSPVSTKFGNKSYKSFEGTVPPNTDFTDLLNGLGIIGSYYLIYNDSSEDLLQVKVNSLDNDTMTIKPLEWFGNEGITTAFYISNPSTSHSVDYRLRLGGTFSEDI
jgi:hypothetical protein